MQQQIPIYYINLHSRPNRRIFMESQFARLDINASRIEAVTPGGIPSVYQQNYGNPRKYQWLTPTEMACSLSHMDAMRQVVRSGAPLGVIFEDDVVLSSALPATLPLLEAWMAGIDVLRIETANEALRLARRPDFSVNAFRAFRLISWCAGSAGYIVTAEAAARLSSSSCMRRFVADDALFNPYRLIARQFVVRQLTPALCIQTDRQKAVANLSSDIEPERRRRAISETPYYWRSLVRRIGLVLDRDVRMGTQKTWHELIGNAKKQNVPFVP